MITTPAILLSARDVGEVDRLYTFYTRDHGKIEALATGVRKMKSKLAGHCVPHAIIRATFFPGRSHMRLVQASGRKRYRLLTSDMRAFAVAAYARETVDMLTKPGITDATIFVFLCRLFEGLEHNNTAPQLLLHAFIFHFLSALGFRPLARTIKKNQSPALLLQSYLTKPLASEQFLRLTIPSFSRTVS